MAKVLKRVPTLYHYVDGVRVKGKHDKFIGDCPNLGGLHRADR